VALICAGVDRLPGLADLPASTAVVVGSAWGNVVSTLRFAADLQRYGDAQAAPAAFTTSVHHNPAGTVGELRGWHGPAHTVSLGNCSGLAALRQGVLLTRTRREPTVVVAADVPESWVRDMAQQATQCPWPIGGGVTVLLLQPDDAGWEVSFDPDPDLPAYDAGGATPAEERRFARSRTRQLPAATRLGQWYPTASLAAAPWEGTAPFQVIERDSGHELRLGFRRR
jgi:hypothetical protein